MLGLDLYNLSKRGPWYLTITQKSTIKDPSVGHVFGYIVKLSLIKGVFFIVANKIIAKLRCFHKKSIQFFRRALIAWWHPAFAFHDTYTLSWFRDNFLQLLMRHVTHCVYYITEDGNYILAWLYFPVQYLCILTDDVFSYDMRDNTDLHIAVPWVLERQLLINHQRVIYF